MAEKDSVRLREALERLDQAIDRLESRVAATVTAPSPAKPSNEALAERLDRVIERVEWALAG